jgi:hypothetical protein
MKRKNILKFLIGSAMCLTACSHNEDQCYVGQVFGTDANYVMADIVEWPEEDSYPIKRARITFSRSDIPDLDFQKGLLFTFRLKEWKPYEGIASTDYIRLNCKLEPCH